MRIFFFVLAAIAAGAAFYLLSTESEDASCHRHCREQYAMCLKEVADGTSLGSGTTPYGGHVTTLNANSRLSRYVQRTVTKLENKLVAVAP
jgi:hypothetical protein